MSARPARPVRFFHRFTAGGCAALVLALAVLAACPALHEWLHGGHDLGDDDGCVVTLFAHGVTEAGAAVALVVVALRLLAEKLPAPAALFLAEPRFQLPPGRGPPQD